MIPPILKKGDYIYGSFLKPEVINGYIKSSNPSQKEALIGQYVFSFSSMSQAIAYASASHKQWKKRSIQRRIDPIKRLQEDIVKHHHFIAKTISLECGYPLHESSSEVNESILFLQYLVEATPSILEPIAQKSHTKNPVPLGSLIVLTPHVHSFFYSIAFCASALIAGNVVVHKPSRYTPAIGQLVAEILDRCSLKRGVYNMVQGPGTHLSQQIIKNTLIDGILFAGEYDTASIIHRRSPPHLPLRLFCGGKSTALILPDADLEQACNLIISAMARAGGQSPHGVSRILVHEAILDDVLETIESRIQEMHIVAPNTEESSQLGPMISEQSLQYYIDQGGSIEKEGHTAILPAKKHKNTSGFFAAPSLFRMHTSAKDLFLDVEIKGPTLLVYTFKNDEDIHSILNKLSYRRSLSIFTTSTPPPPSKEHPSFGGIYYNNIPTLPIASTSAHGRCGNGYREGLGILRSVIQYSAQESIQDS